MGELWHGLMHNNVGGKLDDLLGSNCCDFYLEWSWGQESIKGSHRDHCRTSSLCFSINVLHDWMKCSTSCEGPLIGKGCQDLRKQNERKGEPIKKHTQTDTRGLHGNDGKK